MLKTIRRESSKTIVRGLPESRKEIVGVSALMGAGIIAGEVLLPLGSTGVLQFVKVMAEMAAPAVAYVAAKSVLVARKEKQMQALESALGVVPETISFGVEYMSEDIQEKKEEVTPAPVQMPVPVQEYTEFKQSELFPCRPPRI